MKLALAFAPLFLRPDPSVTRAIELDALETRRRELQGDIRSIEWAIRRGSTTLEEQYERLAGLEAELRDTPAHLQH